MINRLSSDTSSTFIQETIKKKIDTIESVKSRETERNPAVKGQDGSEPIPKEKVQNTIDGLNKFFDQNHTSLKFQFHEKLQEYYVTLVDENTKEVVREIPPKKMLDFYAAMTEFLGLIVDKKI